VLPILSLHSWCRMQDTRVGCARFVPRLLIFLRCTLLIEMFLSIISFLIFSRLPYLSPM